MARQKIIISFLGTVLDKMFNRRRWEKWRPNVSLLQQPDFPVAQLELFYDEKFRELAEFVKKDQQQLQPDCQVHLVPMNLANPWDFAEVYEKLFDWAVAYPFDPEQADYYVHITTGTHVAQICLFLLVQSRQIPAVLLQTAPPRGEETIGRCEFIDLDLAKYDVLAKRLADVRADAVSYLKSGIATRNPAFNQMIAEIEAVALNSPAPILLNGPTGAGKSLLARRIYELKKARHQIKGRFIDVNCATLRGDGAASALFGHRRGAFTGAVEQRDGYLKSADQGLLFLDEIGELGLDEQAMLLKALEEKRFYAVGSDREEESNFQLIAGTNRDLRAEVRGGRFREDLFARINIWTYQLPALAQRREDIEPNMRHQLALLSQELGRTTRFNREAQRDYLNFALSPAAPWPGNFRDLSASLLRLATLAPGGRIDRPLVAAEIQRLQWLWREAAGGPVHDALIPADLDLFDQLQLAQVLKLCREHPSLASAGRALFNQSRSEKTNDSDRLRKYLKKFGLSWDAIKS